VVWEIELTDQAIEWLHSLDQADRTAIAGAADLLELYGPNLGRPALDSIKCARHHNMKELRSMGGNLRALFRFDPRRTAIDLLGGDKTDDWSTTTPDNYWASDENPWSGRRESNSRSQLGNL
jgi:hypothetical protein